MDLPFKESFIKALVLLGQFVISLNIVDVCPLFSQLKPRNDEGRLSLPQCVC